MKKLSITLCAIFILLCLFTLVACGDNTNDQIPDDDQTDVVGEIVTEQVWNAQLDQVLSSQNYTMSLDYTVVMNDGSTMDALLSYLFVVTEDVIFIRISENSPNSDLENQQYYIFAGDTRINYDLQDNGWRKTEYVVGDHDYFESADGYLNSYAPFYWAYQEICQDHSLLTYADFSFDGQTGIFSNQAFRLASDFSTVDVSLCQLKFVNDKLASLTLTSAVTFDGGKGVYTVNFYDFDTTEITLPNFS